MATNSFNSTPSLNIGTTATTIYTAPTTTGSTPAIATIIGCSLSNKSSAPVSVTVTLLRSTVSYSLLTGASIPVGGSLVIAGGDEKFVLKAQDQLQALCSAANAVDTFVSALEIT